MARIAGIKYNKTNSGKVKSITIDLSKWGEYLEDFIDLIEAEAVKRKNDFISWDKAEKMLDKKSHV